MAGGDARVSPLSNSRVQTSLDWWIKIPVTGRKTKPSPAPLSFGRFWGRMCLMVVMRRGHIRTQAQPAPNGMLDTNDSVVLL